jgi:putative peptide zinc metalloprotease protein
MPLWQAGKFFYVPGRIEQVKKPHFYTSLGLLAALLLAFFFLPLPHSVICTLRLQPRGADPVWVHVPGKLVSVAIKPGQRVAAGQQLAQLQSTDVELAVAKLEGTVADYETQIQNVMRSARDPRVTAQLPQLQEALAAAQDELKEKRIDQERLRLAAPAAGTVLAPPLVPRHDDPDEKLPNWGGSPLDPENLGAYLKPVLFCQIGDPTKLEAVLIVDQADRSLIRAGEDGSLVDLKLEGYPALTLRGKRIAEISESELRISPQALSNKNGGDLATKTDPHTGAEKPMNTSYEARVPIDNTDGSFCLNLRGQARVHTIPLSLGARLWRAFNHTFNFKLGS